MGASMTCHAVTLTAFERQEHQALVFEASRSPVTLNALLAELIVLRKLRAAVRANRHAPPRVEGVLARLPAHSTALDWAQAEPEPHPEFELIHQEARR